MPPKVKITKQEIIQTALELLRRNGDRAINARSLAHELDCSTQPIFSNFSTMEELQKSVINAAYELYLSFLHREAERGEYPTYKAYGMAYIRFAKEEKQLFKLLFMRDRTGEDLSPSSDFEQAIEILMKTNGVSHNTATVIHLETCT